MNQRSKAITARIARLGLALAVLLTAGSARAGTTLSIGATNGSLGGRVLVPINLTSTDNPVTLQMEVIFDGARLISEPAVGGAALADHLVASSEPSNGVRRIVIYSLTNAQMTNGTISQLPFTISEEAAEGAIAVTMTNVVVLSSTGARIAPVNLVGGSLTVSAAAPARLGSIERASDGRVQFQVSGTSGRSYVIQASTNLVQWSGLSTNVVTGTAINFVDSTATNYNQRFYRAVLVP